MSKLTEEARSLIDSGRDAFAPSPEVTARLRDRIRRASEASDDSRSRASETSGRGRSPETVALPAPEGAGEPAQSSLVGRVWSTNRGLILLVAAIGLTASVSTSTLMSRRGGARTTPDEQRTLAVDGAGPRVSDSESRAPEPRRSPDSESQASESQASKSHAAEAPNPEFKNVEARTFVNESPRIDPPPASVSAAPVVQKKRSALPGSSETDSLEAEMLLIGAAQAALKSDARSAVTENLDEHERRFPRGLLREERLTLRVRLLCVEGRAEEAKRALRALENEHPRSSHLASLRDSCVGAGE